MQKPAAKTGIFFFDQGGLLGRAISLDAVIQRLGRIKNVARCEVADDLTTLLPVIKNDIRSGKYDRILWAGSFTDHLKKTLTSELASAGLNPYMHEWCDLQEQGIGTNNHGAEIATQKALILVQMSLGRNRLLEPLDPVFIPAVDAVLVVGAGVAGLHAATSLAKLGKKIHLLEQQSGVGGKVAMLHRLYPRLCDPRCGLEFEVQKIRESDKIEVHTLSDLKSIAGGPGNFDVTIATKARYVSEERCTACGECAKVCPVLLSGQKTGYEPALINEPAEKLLNPLNITTRAIHPAAPMPFPSAYVIERQHCLEGCNECKKACPANAVDLGQATTESSFKVGTVIVTTGWDPYPLAKVEEYGYGVYPNVVSNMEMERLIREPQLFSEVGFIQCAGSRDERHLAYCSSVCCSVSLKQVLFLKEKQPDARCYVFYQDIRTPGFDEELYQKVKSFDNVIFIRGNPSTVRPADDGRLLIRAEDTLSGREIELHLDLLVLAGGMEPSAGTRSIAQILNLPQNPFGFFETHLQCHPEESQRSGIVVGGTCRGPMNISQSIESTHRAIVEILPFLDKAVCIEPTYPVLDTTKCDKCKRCVEECPFSSYVFDENGFPVPDLAKCRHCGNCMGICPLIAISLRHYTIKQIAAQVQAIKASFMGREEPVILAFLCENDAYYAARTAAISGLAVPPNVFFIKVPCAGAVNNAVVADALSFGIDGVLIAGCRDNECHYVRGNQLVRTRSSDLSDKLQKMMIEPQRVRFENIEIRDSQRYVELVNLYLDELRAMGPNPFKK